MVEATLASAKIHTELIYPDAYGTVKLTELLFLEESKGIRDKSLDEMNPPPEAASIYQLYWSRFRGSGVTYQEIKAYEEIEGFKLEPWEVDLLFLLHARVENTIAEIAKKNRPKK